MSTNSIEETLRHLRGGYLLSELEEQLAKVVQAVDATGKAGKLTIQLLQMALAFEASSEKRVRSAVRLQSGGVNIEHVDTDDAATVTRMQAFDRFRLGLAPFWRGDSYPLEAKLRYRNSSSGLSLWYDLVRPDRVVDYAVEEILAKIEAATTIKPIFGGIV